MATIVSHVRNHGRHLGIGTKHVFTASNKNIIRNKCKRRNQKNAFKKLQFSISKFNLHNLFYINHI